MEPKGQIKQKLYELIRKSEDEGILQIVYQILNQDATKQKEIQLTKEQEKELLAAYKESFEEDNLIDHETMVRKNSKWLGE